MQVCGAKTRSGAPCQNAGMENGRCRMHGGTNPGAPIKHGRYSKYAPDKLGEKIAEFREGNALDMADELATQRALFADYLARFESIAMTRDDADTLQRWLDNIIRSGERINKMRNEDTLTAAEVVALQARAVDIAMRYFNDSATRRQFLIDLFGTDAESDRQPRFIDAG